MAKISAQTPLIQTEYAETVEVFKIILGTENEQQQIKHLKTLVESKKNILIEENCIQINKQNLMNNINKLNSLKLTKKQLKDCVNVIKNLFKSSRLYKNAKEKIHKILKMVNDAETLCQEIKENMNEYNKQTTSSRRKRELIGQIKFNLNYIQFYMVETTNKLNIVNIIKENYFNLITEKNNLKTMRKISFKTAKKQGLKLIRKLLKSLFPDLKTHNIIFHLFLSLIYCTVHGIIIASTYGADKIYCKIIKLVEQNMEEVTIIHEKRLNIKSVTKTAHTFLDNNGKQKYQMC